MSDPFGDDDLDFNTEKLLSNAYNNAIFMLKENRPTQQTRMPTEIVNPLKMARPALWNRGVDSDQEGAFGSGTGGGMLVSWGAKREGRGKAPEPSSPPYDPARSSTVTSSRWEA
jgi:hypothetical protein